MSDDQNLCPDCGAPIPDDAPGGGCPGCLVEAALDPEPPEGVPSRESLAALFPDLEIQALLGRGGMGAVFRALQTKLGRTVALKILPAQEGARGAAFADRFAREARALARLDHPNIVRVHEFGERGGVYFLVMEYVDGVNLREAMLDGDIAPRQALAIVPQICDALQYAHDHGVVHRDIKPENVLLAKDGTVKVADFGLAKMMVGTSEDATLTRAGQVMGTVHYMAPEQVESPASVDHRADIYSLGVVFYEMLTGELPVGRFAPPSQRARVDARLDQVVLRALERKRERRYQKVSDVKAAVSGIDDPGSGAPVPPGGAPTDRARLSVPGLLSLLALPAALLAAPLAGMVARGLGGDVHGAYVAMASTIGVLGFVALLMGVASIVEARRGRHRGLWMGVVGLTAALVWTPALSSAAYYGLDVQGYQARARQAEEERFRAAGRSGTGSTAGDGWPVPREVVPYQDDEFTVTADDATSVPSTVGAALKARLNYLIGAAAAASEAAGTDAALHLVPYESADLPRDEGELHEGRVRGAFGLALLDPGALGGLPMNGFRVVSAHLRFARRRAGGLATARQGNTELTFTFDWDLNRNDWFLGVEPVGIRPVASAADPRVRVVGPDGTPVAEGENSADVARIALRFAEWRGNSVMDDGTRAIRHLDDDERRALLAPGERDDAVRRDAAGLPFSSLQGAAANRGLRVTVVRYADAARSKAFVTAESAGLRLDFPMVRDGEEWWFAHGTVAVEWFEDGDR